MPGYGIAGPDEGAGLLPWAWATERLGTSHDFWVATRWPDGRPHVMPVWGVWADESLWFSSGADSRKTRNLTVDPRAVVTTDDARNPVVVEGTVERVGVAAEVARFARLVNEKYDTDYGVDFFAENACFRLRPTWAFGLESEDFEGTPTRWDFP
jgi:PPOX class probable F420-dependent enzyme